MILFQSIIVLLVSNMSTWQYSDLLVTSQTTCDECDGWVVITNDNPGELTIYTRQGTLFTQHFTKVCPNRWCRKGFPMDMQQKMV